MRGVVHDDAHTGMERRYDPGRGRSSGEWLFVPTGKAEGAGFLLTYVYDAADDGSELVILDAQSVEAGPLASSPCPNGFRTASTPPGSRAS